MIRRVLVIAGIGLGLAGGARFALARLAERAWEKRKAELHELAIFLPPERRPWELRFEALAERVRSSPRTDEIEDSAYRPHVAWGWGEPRPLNDSERVWVEAAGNELSGLDATLGELRRLPLEDLEWHGASVKLLFLRECGNVLCARAWLAFAAGEDEAAVRTYGDALRLARATDDGTLIGTEVRWAVEDIVLCSVRSSLQFHPQPQRLRSELAPLLQDWAFDPDRSERCIRRDLTLLEALPRGEPVENPRWALHFFEPIEEALALAREPVAKTAWEQGNRVWCHVTKSLHARHAQRNVALTALAVAAFRAEHGNWPETLDDVSDLPLEQATDNVTGALLPYSAGETGARIGPAGWAELEGPRPDNWDESLYVWTLR